MNIVVTGYARHGKDTVCGIIAEQLGVSFKSSSEVALETIIYPALKSKYNYYSLEECYADRVNHRKEWFDLISTYNTPNKTKLGRLIYEENTIYCGLRNREELIALKDTGLIDYVIWVDASDRIEAEDTTSCTITMNDADITINNNGTLSELHNEVLKTVIVIDNLT